MPAQWFSRVQLFSHVPLAYSPPGSSVHGTFQARMLECIAFPAFPPPRDPPHPGMGSASPALAGGFCTTEPPGLLVVTQLVHG